MTNLLGHLITFRVECEKALETRRIWYTDMIYRRDHPYILLYTRFVKSWAVVIVKV